MSHQLKLNEVVHTVIQGFYYFPMGDMAVIAGLLPAKNPVTHQGVRERMNVE